MRRIKLVLLATLFALGTATAGVAASTPAVPPADSDCANTICERGNSQYVGLEAIRSAPIGVAH